MKSSRPKVLHRVAGTSMITHVLETARSLQPRSLVVVEGADLPRHRLALEPGREAGLLDQRLLQHLDRDLALELNAARAVHHADATIADDLEQLVALVEHLTTAFTLASAVSMRPTSLS